MNDNIKVNNIQAHLSRASAAILAGNERIADNSLAIALEALQEVIQERDRRESVHVIKADRDAWKAGFPGGPKEGVE